MVKIPDLATHCYLPETGPFRSLSELFQLLTYAINSAIAALGCNKLPYSERHNEALRSLRAWAIS